MNEKPPKVSVIIPTFNRAEFILESLQSVLNQTYRDIEVIVVDDGSTDSTEQVLQPFMGRIKYVKQINEGVSGASNRGVREARGEYVAFQGSDDYWLPDKLERQMAFLQQHPQYVMVTGNAVNFGNKKIEGKPAIPWRKAARLQKEGISLQSTFMKSSIRGATMVVKKSVLEEVGGFDTRLKSSVDVELAFRLLRKYEIGFQNEVLMRIRKHKDNLGKDRESGQIENIKAVKALLAAFPEAESVIGRKNIGRRLAYRYYRLAKIYHYRRLPEKTLENIRLAHQLAPQSLKYFSYLFFFELNYLNLFHKMPEDCVKVTFNGWDLYIRKNCLLPSFFNWLKEEAHNPLAQYDSSSRHAGIRRMNVMIDGEEKDVFVKQFFSTRLTYALKDLFRPSKAMNASKMSFLLKRFGFHAAPLVVAGERRKSGFLQDAFLVTDAVRAPTIPEFVEASFPNTHSPEKLRKKRALIRSLAAEVGRMHLLGIIHGDLLPGNILVDDSNEPAKFIYLDNDRTRRFISMRIGKFMVRNLVQLGRFPLTGITLTDRLRFFHSYIEQNPIFKGWERQLLTRIVAKTRERMRLLGSTL